MTSRDVVWAVVLELISRALQGDEAAAKVLLARVCNET